MFSHSWMYFFNLLRSFVFIWVSEINLNPREHEVELKKKKAIFNSKSVHV